MEVPETQMELFAVIDTDSAIFFGTQHLSRVSLFSRKTLWVATHFEVISPRTQTWVLAAITSVSVVPS